MISKISAVLHVLETWFPTCKTAFILEIRYYLLNFKNEWCGNVVTGYTITTLFILKVLKVCL